MGNRLKGEVTLAAGDKTYTMAMSINALCILEDELGKTAPEIFTDLDEAKEKVSVKTIRTIMWAALSDKHPGLSKTEAGQIIEDAGGVVTILGKLAEAITAAFPKPAATEGAKSDEPRPT